MEGKNCWHMQIFCSIFVAIVEMENQVLYNILYRRLKRLSFLFRTPARPYSPSWLIIKECAFSPAIYDNVRSVFWNSFTQMGFPETNQAARVNEFFIISRCTIFLDLSEFLFTGAATLVPWHRGLRVLGTMDGNFKLVQLESVEKHIPVLFLRALWKTYWKGEMRKTYVSILYHWICPMTLRIWMSSYILS